MWSMKLRMALACLAACLVLGGCGGSGTSAVTTSDSGAPARSPTSSPATESETDVADPIAEASPLTITALGLEDLPPRQLPEELRALDGIDLDAVWKRGCLMWSFTEQRDHGAINDAVNSFLWAGQFDATGTAPTFTRSQLARFQEVGVPGACAAGNIEQAWGIIAGVLDLTDAEFTALVRSACASYAFSEGQPEEFKPREKTWDVYILAALGVDDLTDVIEQVCGGFDPS